MKPSDTRKKMIAKIKIGQKELAMAEQDYRAMLLRVTGKSSCALLSEGELERVLRELGRLGFASQSAGRRPLRRVAAKPLMGKIEALLLDNGWTWAYANGTAKRMFGVERVEYLDNERLHKVAAALQIAANRKRKNKGGDGDGDRTRGTSAA
ncbi:gp16 family protein [Bergeriella denitrificans]|uniref:Phage protein n=1 Tax=Bergeriella denitrificans TaxID=494 RepID=A0A378UDR1_BERDE|nr:regulatory protein GemA [Bergeriella denitrificans]STZ75544.1 phage protein [Bergeriella denitrificans]